MLNTPALMYNYTKIYNFAFNDSSFSSLTLLTNVPIPLPRDTLTESPSFKKSGGFLANPTPFGVPVRMMVPG